MAPLHRYWHRICDGVSLGTHRFCGWRRALELKLRRLQSLARGPGRSLEPYCVPVWEEGWDGGVRGEGSSDGKVRYRD